MEYVTPEQLLRRSSRTIRAPDRYSPSLHILLLTDEGEPESFDEALQVEVLTRVSEPDSMIESGSVIR